MTIKIISRDYNAKESTPAVDWKKVALFFHHEVDEINRKYRVDSAEWKRAMEEVDAALEMLPEDIQEKIMYSRMSELV